jgi:hypothetical protein
MDTAKWNYPMTKPGTERGQRKPAKPDNPDQYRRFVETARELGADESPDVMDRAFERVVRKPERKPEPAPRPKKPR